MATHKAKVSTSYDQVVAAWSVICLTFNGLDEVSHGCKVFRRENDNATSQVAQSTQIVTSRGDLLKQTSILQSDADTPSQDILAVLLDTVQPRHSVLTQPMQASSPKSNTCVLLITGGERPSSVVEELNTRQPHIVCRIDESSSTVEVSFLDSSHSGKAAQATRLAGNFCLAIEQVTNHWASKKTFQDIDIFSDNDLTQILDWNTASSVSAREPVNATLLDSIQTIAQNVGGCLALGSSERTVSYADLVRLSDVLATKLLQHGLQVASYLPIVSHKSISAVVAMLAAWKCGSAFVLISPDLPSERHKSIMAQIGSKLSLLVDDHDVKIADDNFNAFPEPHLPIITPDSETLPGCTLFDAAYVIFTSGTTGQPKGVVVEHHSISKSMKCLVEASGLTASTRTLQYASFTFDACILEIFSTLIAGGTVYMPTNAERNNDLSGYVQRYNLNTMLLTPSVLQTLHPKDFPTMHTVFTGGEKMSALAVEKWSSQVRLLNAYGPTETSVLCSLHDRVTTKTAPENIGKALGSSLWVVDAGDPDRLVPCGAVGELVVCGSTLARGYLNDPASTAKSFLPNPTWSRSLAGTKMASERAYCTGDLVRYDADGSIHIVGRKDQQVKLRGQRIELAEIELAVRNLLPHDLEIAVDVARPGGAHSAPQMVLFTVIQPDDDFGVPISPGVFTSGNAVRQLVSVTVDLADRLSGLLPSYMIPSIFIPVSALPLTRSAKLDRSALKVWVEALTATDLARLAASSLQEDHGMYTKTEEELRKLWCQVLSLSPEHVSRKSHFFRLGGDSIKAMQLVALGRHAGYSITVETMFKCPALSDMASRASHSTVIGHDGMSDPAPFSLLEALDSHADLEKLKLDAAAQCEVGPDLIEDIYPCTALQEGMLALTLQNPDAYIANFTFESSSVDIERLQQAWDLVVRETSVLRTRFVSGTSGHFLQVVLRHQPHTVTIAKALDAGAHTPIIQFGLGAPSNCISILTSNSGLGASVTWFSHHATYDAITVQHVINDVEKLYYQQEPLHIRNFAAFIQGLRTANKQDDTRRFWIQRLEGSQSCAFPAQPTSHIVCAADSSSRMIAFSQHKKREITLANTVRAAWALVLSQHTGSDEVVFGVTSSGRTLPIQDIDLIRGPTIATAPVRVSLSRRATLQEFLSTVQEQAVAMIPYESFGLQNIRDLSPSAASACDLRSLLILQFPESEFVRGHEKVMVNTSPAMEDVYTYPLNIECVFQDDAIIATAKYDNTLMSEVQADRILANFDSAIQSVMQVDQSIPVEELRHISEMDMETIMGWNSNAPTLIATPIHELVMEQARTQPAAPAVSAWDGNLTYSQLMMHSTSLVRTLEQIGVTKGDIVPICFEKSVWTQVAILAVLLNGATFVLLDPKLPSDRLAAIVEDVDARLSLCQRSTEQVLSACSPGLKLLRLDESLSMGQNSEEVQTQILDLYKPTPVAPEDSAYIVFTSGSTGKPKGIVVSHSALSSSAMAHGKAIQIDSQARVLQFAAYSFDVSIGDMLVTLALGGCVCVPSEAQRMDDLGAAIRSLEVNHACITSTVAMQLDPLTVPGLRRLVIGGEPMDQALIERWATKLDLINIYGPAECTIWCAGKLSLTHTDQASDIGQGLGALMWISEVDQPDKLASIGAVGELLLEGPTLAQGYFKDPTKTTESFIIDPIWTRAEAKPDCDTSRRVYRTGDLVRYGLNGSIEFVGRRDRQVKLRGQRIELAEIELHLRRSMPQGMEAIVEMGTMQGQTGTPQLIAFINVGRIDSGDRSCTLSTERRMLENFHAKLSEIEEYMASKLPVYMVPTLYLPMEGFPLSSSGKLDRKTLKVWAEALPASASLASRPRAKEHQAPSGEMENILSSLWSIALELEEKISRDDHFFRLGGDSIKAMKLSASARRAGMKLSVQSIFKYPCLERMAKEVDTLVDDEARDKEGQRQTLYGSSDLDNGSLVSEVCLEMDEILPEDVEHASLCTPLQEGLVSMSLKRQGAYIARLTFDLPAETDLDRLQEAWLQMLKNNPILRSVFVSTKAHGVVQLVMKRQDGLVESRHAQETEGHAVDFAFTLGRPNNVMTLTPAIGGKVPTLTWAVNHAAYDGWSLYRYLIEVNDRYYGNSVAPVTSFDLFVRHVRSLDRQAAEHFWAQYLQGCESCDFPVAATEQLGLINATATVKRSFMLPQLHLQGVTTANLLRAAWAIVIARSTRSEDVVFASTMSGRNVDLDGIDTVRGPTIATIPVRIRLDKGLTPLEYLKRVQDEGVAVMPHEQYGLQYISRVSENAQHACKAQSLLVVQPAENLHDLQTLELFAGSMQHQDVYTHPLTMECSIGTNGMIGVVATYDDRLCAEDLVRRLSRDMERAVHMLGNAQSPSKDVSWEELMNPHQEDVETLKCWNDHVPEPSSLTIDSLFDRSVDAAPNKIALSTNDAQITYEDLSSLTTAFATHLKARGVGRGSLVGLCFDKSWRAVVAMMSVLKAGGAFFALDPTHPAERMREIVDRMNSTLIVTSKTNTGKAENFHRHVVCIEDALSETAGTQSQHQLPTHQLEDVAPSDLAFVLFTSGSTGTPKGIEITHGAFCSSITAHAPRLSLDSGSRVLQFSAYTYDVSMAEIFTSLAVGACICIPSSDDRLNRLTDFMTEQKVNWTFQTPTMASFLEPKLLPTLKTLVLGGEGATEHNLQTWCGSVQLINSYGPAECSIWTNCAAGIAKTAERRNVGLPVGCSIYVSNPQDPHSLLPLGAVGELLVGGPNIARGYWNDHDKTASSFLSDLRWMHEFGCTGTVYRTGDLGRYCADGTVEVHGRKDRQVKLRGQRIELPEVEFRLRQCLPHDIDLAVDVIRSGTSGNSAQLTAFIVLPNVVESATVIHGTGMLISQEAIVMLNDLVGTVDLALSELLPPYMIPSLYIPVTALPLSTSAKLDRNTMQAWSGKLLPAHLSILESHGKVSGEPQNELEVQLQQLWSDTLQCPISDIHRGSHFFRLGGDSIKAMQLGSVCSRHDLRLTVEMIFKHPVLCHMAAKLQENKMDDKTPLILAAPKAFSLLGSNVDIGDFKADVAVKLSLTTDVLDDIYPCTALQEGMLTLSLKQPGTYVGRFTFSLPDDADLDKLEAAWIDVAHRTPIMRTRFVTTKTGHSMQVVVKDQLVVQRVKANESHGTSPSHAVGLEDIPITRVEICEQSVMWEAHHAVYDGLTIRNILSDVEATYRGLHNISPCVPFNHFVELSSMSDADEALSFWRAELDGAQQCEFPALPMPDYQPRPTALLRKRINLSRTTCTGVTSSNLLRAAWALTVSQFLGQNDVIFGLTISGRNLPLDGIQSVRGPTIATVPLRLHLNNDWNTMQYLQHVQASAVAMIPFEHLGLQNIQRLSESARSACDVRSLLILQSPETEAVNDNESPQLLMSRIPESSLDGFYTHPLTLECIIGQSDIDVTASYDESIISTTHLQRVLTYFDEATQHLASGSATARVGDLKQLSATDREQINMWNDKPFDCANRCIHDLVIENARQHPTAPAVSSWDGDLQYDELVGLSLTLAETLRMDFDIGTGDYVPICFEKGKWTQIAMLGILCAGAAFVPLDPTKANARRDSIIRDVAAKVVLCSQGTESALLSLDTPVMVINDHPVSTTSHYNGPRHDKKSTTSAKDAAYIVFTSGSTGTPKGIVVDHSALTSSTLAHGRAIKLDQNSRVLQFAAYTFDVSIGDILTTLALGGCVCVPSESQRINDLPGAIQRMNVNHACLTSTVALQLDPDDVPSLKRLVIGGEPMDEALVGRWADRVHLVNIYGPAECTIWCMGKEVLRHDSSHNIGWGMGAIPWLVDPSDAQKLVPIGSIGELALQGPTLARCYFKDPQKTNAAFLQKPAWLPCSHHGQQGRIYLTGDLARYGQDGALHFIGRKDRQVKIRGQRIELAEVEVILRELLPVHTEVAVEVITPSGSAGTPTLAAFVRTMPNHASQQAETPRVLTSSSDSRTMDDIAQSHQQRLSELLPPYMIPTIYIPISALPLSLSAKLDRQTLKKWGSEHSLPLQNSAMNNSVEGRRLPESDLELSISSLWQSVLGLTYSPGRDDHFFRLGGDSIRAMQMVNLARRKDIALSVEIIFRYPVLLKMAAAMVDHDADKLHEISDDESDHLKPYESLNLSSEDLDQLRHEASSQCQISVDDIQDMYPCTPLQEGLLTSSFKDPGLYIARLTFELPDGLDVATLKRAWKDVLRRTPALRTMFFNSKDKGMVQVVLRDFFAWSDDVPQAFEEDFVEQFANQTLIKPLCGFCIHGRELTWTLHHALYDAFSLNLILRLLDWEYNQTSRDPPPYTICGYRGYIADVSRQEKSKAKDFWKNYLSDTPDATFPQAPKSGYRPSSNRTIDAEMPHGRRSTSTTVANVLRAAWALTVSSYANLDDVVFGTTLHGRDSASPHASKAAGPTIVTVPVRTVLDSDTLLGEMLQSIHDDSVNITAHAHLGLREVSKLSTGARHATHFQHMLLINDASTTQGTSKVLDVPQNAGNSANFQMYALEVECQIQTSRIGVKMYYDTEVVNDSIARWILDHFRSVFSRICSAPGSTKISELRHATENESVDLITANASLPVEVSHTLHGMFANKATGHPNRTAVSAWDGCFTYKNLDTLSENLALMLLKRGVGLGSHVVLCFEKSKWVCVAMLAILKAGGVCVPLNDTYPAARARYVVDHVNADVCLSTSRCAKIFDGCSANVIVVEEDMDGLFAAGESEFPVVTPDSAAFVMFTSGTTGYPKGVIQTHANLVTSTLAIGTRLGSSSSSRILQFASFTFDVSLGDIFGAFFFGACVCIPSEEQRLDALDEFIEEQRVDQACLTPAVARTLVGKDLQSLRTLSLGGEPLQLTDIRQWAGRVRLQNIYGVTECTIWCAISDPIPEKSTSPKNFGYGMGARLWIVDPTNTDFLMPPGAMGELLIEGPIVAQGYLHDEAKTRASFIENPQWHPAKRQGGKVKLYKTGDLVRLENMSSYSYICRKDTQIKINGQRVELGEIENQLQLAVPHGWLTAVEQLPMLGSHVLVAFITPRDPAAATQLSTEQEQTFVAKTRSSLSTVLPSHMLPVKYIFLASMPLSASGKINRQALREHDVPTIENDDLDAPSRVVSLSDEESQLGELWKTSIRLHSRLLRPEDNYFAIGGDSLSAMRLVSCAREVGVHLSVHTIFAHPTLEDMALQATLTHQDKSQVFGSYEPFELIGDLDLKTIKATANSMYGTEGQEILDILPTTPLQHDYMMAAESSPGWFCTQFVVDLIPSVELQPLLRALNILCDAHEIFRTRIFQHGTRYLQVVYDRYRSPTVQSEDLSTYLEANKNLPFVAGGEMQRTTILQAKDGRPLHLIWSAHHAIYDGWSIRLILRRLSEIYGGANTTGGTTGEPFGKFVKHISQISMPSAQTFWTGELSGTQCQPLQGTGVSGREPCASAYYEHQLAAPARMTENVGSTGSITLSTIVYAAMGLLLCRRTASPDAVLSLTLTGRNEPIAGIEDIIAPMITMVPLRVHVDQTITIATLLREVHQRRQATIPWEHTGWGNIAQMSPECAIACQNSFPLVIQNFQDHEKSSSEAVSFDAAQMHAVPMGSPPLPILSECQILDSRIAVSFRYDPDRFEHAVIAEMGIEFESLVNGLGRADGATQVKDLW